MKAWLLKYRKRLILGTAVLAVLAGAFWFGGGAPGLQGWRMEEKAGRRTMETEAASKPQEEASKPAEAAQPAPQAPPAEEKPAETAQKAPQTAEKPKQGQSRKEQAGSQIEKRPGGTEGGMSADEKVKAAAELAGASSPGVSAGDKNYSESQGMKIDASTGKDQYLTDPVPQGKPIPIEPQNAVVTDKQMTCTLSISCATINGNLGWLDPEKVELVPKDGWILPPTTVTFYEGESVFNVLLRTCKQKKIHMEYENTPIYNSAYIEGIHNLYEFDCGELSGWMYQVNGWFPNYGCSRYQLKEGDVIKWEYTCNLGIDVGGYSATGG